MTESDPARKRSTEGDPSETPPGSKAQEFLRADRGVSAMERDMLTRRLRESDESIDRLNGQVAVYHRLVGSAQQLAKIHDPETLLGRILEEVVALCGVDRGFVLLADPDGRLSIRSGFDVSLGHLDATAGATVSVKVAQRAFKEKRAAWYSDAMDRDEFRHHDSIQSLQLNVVVTVPLMVQDNAIGVLYLDSRRPDALVGQEALPILEGFAGHAAIALNNAQLHSELVEARSALERENRDLRRAMPGAEGISSILGRSRAIEELRRKIGHLQEVNSHVLILGETGTGKELVARAIHAGSLRAGRPYLVLDCASVPRDLMESEVFGYRRGAFTGAVQDRQGLIEAADGGTLFLDEIGEMPMGLQSKLLRAIEAMEFRRIGENTSRKVDVRILSATNRNLELAIENKEFREDLYWRLRVVTLTLPPLRERVEDILPLAEHFLKKNRENAGRPYPGFTAAAVRFLLNHPWPGNVREVRNVIEGACVYLAPGAPIDEEDLRVVVESRPAVRRAVSPAGSDAAGLRPYKDEAERQVLQETLDLHKWNVSRAAKAIGISRQHLHNRIKYHNLQRPTS
jgi:Nif-specific regulatory protein